MSHPHSLPWFATNRREIHSFVTQEFARAIQGGKRFILTCADVKAGKREIVECCKLLFPSHKAYYLTSLDRKDVKAQKEELQKYGIDTFVVNSDAIAEEIQADIESALAEEKKVLLFWDECDYGSGNKQKMSPLFQRFLGTMGVIHNLISATPEETLFSSISSRADFIMLKFTPPPEYCGAKYFLANNLVCTPKAFFEKDDISGELSFTAHALEIMRERFTSQRNIGCVRLTGKAVSTDMVKAQLKRLQEELTLLLAELGRECELVVIDGKNPFEWERETNRNGYAHTRKYFIFFLNQTCTRGTDLKGWHDILAFWHDKRHCSDCNLNTLLQAILRPSHYSTCYRDASGNPTPQKVYLYVSRAAVMAATGDFSLYTKEKGKAPTRTTRTYTRAEYEMHGVDEPISEYMDLQPYFDAIEQPFPQLKDFPKEGGFYTCRGLGFTAEEQAPHVWKYDDAKTKLKAQFNRNQHYKIVPCYMDCSNPSTLRWMITRKLSKQGATNKVPFKATAKSMYESGKNEIVKSGTHTTE